MHGMGNLTSGQFKTEIANLKRKLRELLTEDEFNKTYIPDKGIFYSDLTQEQENKVWKAMIAPDQGGLDTGLIRRHTIIPIRHYIVSGFSDATAIIGFNGANNQQQYTDAQNRIYEALKNVYLVCGTEVPIVIISHSLGCQIMSNYLWDAQLYWRQTELNERNIKIDPRSIWNKPPDANGVPISFLCLQSLKTWFTTGCNIPIFVSGFKEVRAVENQKFGYQFNWINYFDYDDVLGYPLRPLKVLFVENDENHGQSYDFVTDIQVNANDGIWGAITSSWNPMSHTQYWGDDAVLEALARAL